MSGKTESGYAKLAQLFNRLSVDHPELEGALQELYNAFEAIDDARTLEPRGGGIALADPLPAVWTWSKESGDEVEENAVVLGVTRDRAAAIVTAAGRLEVVPMFELTVKFPPSSPYRLLLGWAEKGNR
jgi:hypothetical protein